MNIQPSDWINARDIHRPAFKPKAEPAIDKEISDIVGKPIKVNNPVLMSLVVKYKKSKGDSDTPDNYLENPEFIKELKEQL